MNPIEQQFFNELEKKLWTAADKLRSSLDASVYKHVVLGLIFLKYVSDAFEERQKELREQFQNPEHDYYPIDKLSRIAELLEVDITDLLDEYNRFLYDGQGWQIRKIRKSMGLTQYQFGKLYGVSAGAVKRWESGKVRVTKGTWERIIKEKN